MQARGRGMLLPAEQTRAMGLGSVGPVQGLGATGGGTPAMESTGRRVVVAGGALYQKLLHPSVIPFEQMYRKIPATGSYDPSVSTRRPVVFEMGAYAVPDKMALCVTDTAAQLYRQGGIDPAQPEPMPPGAMSSVLGFDITVNQQNYGNVSFTLVPQLARVGQGQGAFAGQPSVSDLGPVTAFNQPDPVTNTFGTGTVLQPAEPRHYGSPSIPWTLIAGSNDVVQVRCVIFAPVPSPLAFIEYSLSGCLVPQAWLEELMDAVKPAGGGKR